MKLIPVSSSSIAGVGYDPHTETLRLKFQNGSVYEYNGAPPIEYAEFMKAPSFGSYFNRNIRNNYPYDRIR